MSNAQKTVLGVVVVALALCGAYWIWNNGIVGKSAAPATQTKSALQYQKTEKGDRRYAEDGQYYTIEVTYPDSTPLKELGASADQAAVSQMEMGLKAEIDGFLSDTNAKNLKPEDAAYMHLGGDRKYSLAIDYEKHGGKRSVSYVYTVFVDTGGAHPNTYFKTFTFDTNTGSELALRDLFVSGSDYLTKLKAEAEPIVKAKLAEDLEVSDATASIFEEGFAPKEENYQNFFLDDDMLVIEFPPYQVAAYAAGPREARIPLSKLSSILKSEYK